MAFDRAKKKKITVIAFVTILVVAAFVGTFVHTRKLAHPKKNMSTEIDLHKAGGEKTGILIATVITATTVYILCKYTDFRDICRETLDRIRAGLREPRQLILGGFNAAVDRIQYAIENSITLKRAAKDPRAAIAIDQCKELLSVSVEDLKRSVEKIHLLDVTKIKDNTIELRVWLSGAVTYQETCIDAFENTTGDSKSGMISLMDLGVKLTRNSLAMIDGIIELSGGTPRTQSGSIRKETTTTVVDWKVDQTRVPQQPEIPQQPDKKKGFFNWKINRNENQQQQQNPQKVIVDYKVDQSEELPQPKPNPTVVNWKIDQTEVKQKPTVVNWKVDQSQTEVKQKPTVVNWKVDQSQTEVKQKPTVVNWKVDQTEVKPKTTVVDYRVDQTEVRQPKPPRTKTINIDWKGDFNYKRTRTGNEEDPKQIAGNRRMLDDQEPVHSSKMQMMGDPSDPENTVTPDKNTMPTHEPNTPYPSWTDTSRRSLINVDPKEAKPNAVVAQDGSGGFKTIMEAVESAPKKSNEPFIILIKAGVYKEDVTIPRHTDNVVFLGEGPTKTKITASKNYIDGTSTYNTATVAVNGDGFMAKDIGFENSAGPEKHQAVALRVSADMSIFHNCLIEGHQDTLYTHSYRQFYRQCNITGTIDFIFGNAAAVFQDCRMIVRKPMSNQAGMVTAQGRKDQHSVGGIVMDGCTITAEPAFMDAVPKLKSYLGRPWKEFSRTIIMQSFIDKNIDPEGWSIWAGNFALDTCYYAEYKNNGPGADTSKRVTWKGIKKITPQEAARFTPGTYIQGDQWIKSTNVPYESGLMKV